MDHETFTFVERLIIKLQVIEDSDGPSSKYYSNVLCEFYLCSRVITFSNSPQPK